MNTAAHSYLGQLIIGIGDLVDKVIPLVGVIGTLVFFWGLALFIWQRDKNVEEGRNRMAWGIITLFVMFGVWGLVGLARVFLGLEPYTPPDPGIRNPIPHQICNYDPVLKRDICTTTP